MAIGALMGSALVGAGASLVGNLLGSKSQSDANKTNMQIAQMNNDFNERMMQKQMDYNTEMWNKQNAYNAPAAQVQRLRNAGLNPSLMMGQGQTGTAASAGGVTSASANHAEVRPYIPDFSGIGQAAQQYVALELQKSRVQSENALTDAQTRQMYIENQYKASQLLADIASKSAATKNTQAKTTYQHIENSMRKQMLGAEYELTMRQQQSVEQQTRNMMLQSLMLSKELAVFDERTRLQLSTMSADVLVKLAQKRLTDEQARHEISKALSTFEDVRGKRISNSVANRTADYLVQKARNSMGDVGIMGALHNGIMSLTGGFK